MLKILLFKTFDEESLLVIDVSNAKYLIFDTIDITALVTLPTKNSIITFYAEKLIYWNGKSTHYLISCLKCLILSSPRSQTFKTYVLSRIM